MKCLLGIFLVLGGAGLGLKENGVKGEIAVDSSVVTNDDRVAISQEGNVSAPEPTESATSQALTALEKAGAEILLNQNGQVIAVYLMNPLINR